MSSRVSRLVRPHQRLVRAPRVPLDLQVESRTIGTNASYCLQTADVSRSGMLLVWDRDARVPFMVNTLLEMTIDPTGNCLERPLSCLGKVVRREAEAEDEVGGAEVRFGVQIVQIDNTDLAAWEGCLQQLEQKFGIETSSKNAAAAS